MIGSVAGAGVGIGADKISVAMPKFQGVSKIISTIVVGDNFSEWTKEKYNKSQENIGEDKK